MKWVMFALAFILLFNLASAVETSVTLVDDMGSFTGAVLRLKSPLSEEMGDKIYASKSMANVGIMKFEIETALPEVLLHFMITKNGQVINEFDAGPYKVNGSEITVDRREKIIQEEHEEIPLVEENFTGNITEELENATENISEENRVYAQEITTEESQNDSLENRLSSFVMNGKVIVKNVGVAKAGFGVVGILVIFSLITFLLLTSHKKKKKNNILNEDDKELEYMEKKVKATEARLSQLKSEKEKKRKLAEAKEKLDKEQRELEELEEEEAKNSEEIEDL